MRISEELRAPQLVRISGVNRIGEAGAETEIEVLLSLNQSRTTAIRDWQLEVAVSYADGSTWRRLSHGVKQPENRLVCRVPTRSERDEELIGYEAKMVIGFKTISSVIIHKEFSIPRHFEGERENSSKKERIVILDARPVLDDTTDPGAMRGIDVRWVAEAPAQAVINRFDLEVKATHADGTIRRVCKTVSGAQRQARLAMASTGLEITSIRAGLGATFTWLGSATTAKVGSFRPDGISQHESSKDRRARETRETVTIHPAH